MLEKYGNNMERLFCRTKPGIYFAAILRKNIYSAALPQFFLIIYPGTGKLFFSASGQNVQQATVSAQ